MELEGRNLSLRMEGEDVERLKDELRKLGHPIEADEAGFGRTTHQAVLDFQRKHGLEATGVVDEGAANRINAEVDKLKPEPAEQPQRFIVRGQIRQADGSPFEGALVRVSDRDLRSQQELGRREVGSDGRFEFTYAAQDFARIEKDSADLSFQIENQDGLPLETFSLFRLQNGRMIPVEAPQIIFNAAAQETVEIVISDRDFRGPSEYERYLAEIIPLLPRGLTIEDLTEDQQHQDIAFVTGETGINPQHITFLILAHRLSTRTTLPPEVFYGLFRQSLPTKLPALLFQSLRVLRRALETSGRERIINLPGDLDTILETLQQLIGKHVLQSTEENQKFPLGDLLRTSSLSEDRLEKFVRLYVNREERIEDFWQSLRRDPEFQGAGVVDDLQFTLQLGLLTRNNVPLIKALQGSRRNGTLASLRQLAKRGVNEWQELISSAGAADNIPSDVPGETKEVRVENYVKSITEALKAAFPTTVLGLEMAKAPAIDPTVVHEVLTKNPDIDPAEPLPDEVDWSGVGEENLAKAKAAMEALRLEIKIFPQLDYKHELGLAAGGGSSPAGFSNPIRKGMARFFENEPNFEFANTHVDTYLAEHTATAFDGIEPQYRSAVTTQLKALQRISRVASDSEHLKMFMGEGLDSAYAIASIPQAAFMNLFSEKLGGDLIAKAYYYNAQQIVDINTNIYTGLHQTIYDVSPFVIGGASEAIKKNPNLTTLFGRIDFCDCKHCKSVYSPAAYFVDLLQFLNPKAWKPPKPGQKRPIKVLRNRRPDLEHIKLTCENTNTTLPYADLVNEILEYYVAHDALDKDAAKNTEDITAEELSVQPQYTIEAAYEKLKKRAYPMSLPFDRHLEVARAYIEHLGSSRYRVMDTFRKAGLPPDLAVASEYLKISTRERHILTGIPQPQEPLTALHQFYGYTNPVGWQADIARVTEFLKRTGTKYADLIELLKTRFLNANKKINLTPIVSDSDEHVDLCDLSKIKIANIEPALPKIHRFIRLWRKLTWKIPEVDKVLAALQAQDIDATTLEKLAVVKRPKEELKVPLVALLSFWSDVDTDGTDSLYVKLFQNKQVLNPVDDVFRLRYAASLSSMPNVPFPEAVADKISFDDAAKQLRFVGSMSPDERMLLLDLSTDSAYQLAVDSLYQMRWSDGTELAIVSANPDEAHISKHTPAILAALHINAEDLTALREALALGAQDAPLTLANLSQLYRHALLSKALKLKVKDLIALKVLVGIDPFQPAAPAPTEEFGKKARKVKQSDFSGGELNYLYRNISEPTSNIAPPREQLIELNKQLHDGLKGIADDNVAAPDPIGELTGKKLGTIWESVVVEQMLAMINGSARYSAPLSTSVQAPAFPPSVSEKVAFDSKAGLLSFTGPMTLDERTILLNLPVDTNYQTAINILFQQPREFLSNTKAGFLDLADAQAQLLDTATLTTEAKFGYILERLLPYLRETLSRSFVKQTLGDGLKLDSAMIEPLLETLLTSPTKTNVSVMEDFLALLASGFTAGYFSDPQLAAPLLSRIDAAITFNGHGTTPETAIPDGAGSARWTGMLLAPNNGPFTFFINASGSAQIWLENDSQTVPLQLDPQTNELVSQPITLKAGQLYSLRLETLNLQVPQGTDSAVAELRWSSPSTPKEIIPQGNLYPSSTHAAFATSFSLLHKVGVLVNNFKMTAKELAYLSDHGEDFSAFDLNSLPLDTNGFTVELFNQWERLSDLFTLRNSLPQGEVGLTNLFSAASASADPNALSQNVTDTLIAATGWDVAELSILTGQDGFNLSDDDFKNEIWLLRLQACLKLSRRLGISAIHLFDWASSEPDAAEAQEIITTVKAKYDDEQWLSIGKPLNDGLRERQKSALITYVLAQKSIMDQGITDSNQLFEYFLIDVEMSPCMMTSRIKQAISSVQLFIQRCLMNLEQHDDKPKSSVSPTAIDDEQWKWMKNYRVWEANRKVFLYPENWIEPELRDNKSPFFKELESELRQNDVTLDTAEQAFLNYLYKLDEVAQLEIVGMYHEFEADKLKISTGQKFGRTAQPKPTVSILHVFGRTLNPPYAYYYRRLDFLIGVWTGWEKVNLDIVSDPQTGGVHLIPVVNNRRLYLFWPIFEEKPDAVQDMSGPKETETAEHKQWKTAHAEWEKKNKDYKKWQDSEPALLDIEDHIEWQSNEPEKPGAEPKEPIPGTVQSPPSPLKKHWEIKLAWSEYKQNKWSPKQVSAGFIIYRPEDYNRTWLPRAKDFTFRGVFVGGELVIKALLAEIVLSGPQGSTYPADYSGNTFIGNFRVKGCRGKIEATNEPAFEGIDEAVLVTDPADSDSVFMSFELDTDEPSGELMLVNFDLMSFPVLLETRPSPYSILYPHQLENKTLPDAFLFGFYPFFYQDDARSYFVSPIKTGPVSTQEFFEGQSSSASKIPLPEWVTEVEAEAFAASGISWKFANFFHPHVCAFIEALAKKGIPGLLTLGNQQLKNDPSLSGIAQIIPIKPTVFDQLYEPTKHVEPDYPQENVDFDYGGAYSLYNWELFFHTAMLIATRLSQEQRFEEAQQWFHYIFNPTDSSDAASPRRYWKVLPFFQNAHPEDQQIQRLLEALSYKGNNQQKLSEKKAVENQVAQWRDNPFNPHLIARLRITAYQKNVVMKYIDNLIAWGDQLFRRDTIESINEATMLYVLAANMLGPRPERIPPAGPVRPETYASLSAKNLDSFSNAEVLMETEFPISLGGVSSNGDNSAGNALNLGTTFYFCVPHNDKLLGYWDTVADRLLKIRHCMNIEGIVRQLPLFEPPIDPALLVKAFAMGIDINSVLNDMSAPVPHYRFSHMFQKAIELCGELKSMGGALLSALEKKDAEELSAIRAGHETSMLELVKEIKKGQLDEANAAKLGLEKTRAVTEERHKFYKEIEHRISQEKEYLDRLEKAQTFQELANLTEIGVALAAQIPNVTVGGAGSMGSPVTTATFGGTNAVAALQSASRLLSWIAGYNSYKANMASIKGGWERRSDEWKFQEKLAAKELDQIDQQIAAANIRINIAQQELGNHDKQIENALQVDEFLRGKYTNQELYTWTVGEISKTFFQTYKLAYDIAKRAERAYRFELGLTDSDFIQFGYWDSLRKGLLSGERLYLDLKRMEVSYLDKNRREYEITKHISLMLHDPLQLIRLKESGLCEVELPEALFDVDYPGHYMRRIKNVSLTIPCIVGPYTSVNCTLTLLSNTTRIKSTPTPQYAKNEDGDDDRFVINFAAMQSIAASHAQNDSGLFELNFRDERYLPFEGAGVAGSRWRIELMQDPVLRQFDYDTISDVVVHIKYTARDGGGGLRTAATNELKNSIFEPESAPLPRLFSARHEFPSQWHRFLTPLDSEPNHVFELDLVRERFPFLFRGRKLMLLSLELFLKFKDGVNLTNGSGDLLNVFVRAPEIDATVQTTSLPAGTFTSVSNLYGGLAHVLEIKIDNDAFGKWRLEIQKLDAQSLLSNLSRIIPNSNTAEQSLTKLADAVEDVYVVCHYVVGDVVG